MTSSNFYEFNFPGFIQGFQTNPVFRVQLGLHEQMYVPQKLIIVKVKKIGGERKTT